jgi:Flp pilus assembly protein TadG
MDAAAIDMRPMRQHDFLKDERGQTAVEFAMVGSTYLMFIIGIVYFAMVLFSQLSLQYAVMASARCAAVNTTTCSSASTTETYASSIYYGIGTSPTFVSSNPACGQKVTGTATVTVYWVLGTGTVPLSATACFS